MSMKIYRIGEAAEILNLKSFVLRFWETEFKELAPQRTHKGQRLYSEKDLKLLKRIKFLLHEKGLTIEGAKKALVEEQNMATPQSEKNTSEKNKSDNIEILKNEEPAYVRLQKQTEQTLKFLQQSQLDFGVNNEQKTDGSFSRNNNELEQLKLIPELNIPSQSQKKAQDETQQNLSQQQDRELISAVINDLLALKKLLN
ncbi:MerR family transcriptional regulator [Desulfovibrio litoralis]|uniref:MerR HTH family regulatory protein n=1 Tax=Desulfovibrio litoralis DSM 11393 TaxID=1121455 RepID=A0A1M7SBL4_9BACT|nr:MerR family transcriptional regulator [Desulfovibrio litoralis]SHN55845.1 MerR HTH family regulatory protein [Desulfovibrio litoralis DSM 11393]